MCATSQDCLEWTKVKSHMFVWIPSCNQTFHIHMNTHSCFVDESAETLSVILEDLKGTCLHMTDIGNFSSEQNNCYK